MAYKFQVGAATLSGSTKFEEVLDAAGGIKLSGVSAETASLNADSILFRDSDGTMKHESFSDYGAALAGDGLAATNGVLAVGVDDSSIELNSDALRIKAAGVTDAMLNDDVAAGLAGVGLAAASGVMSLDLNELTAEVLASGDFLAFVDSTDNGTHKETVDDLATLFAGDGLSAASAVLSVNVDDSTIETNSDTLRLKDDGVTGAKLAPAVAGLGLAQDGSGNLDVQVSGAVKIASDKIGISGSIAGDGLAFAGGADSISAISLSIPGMAQSMTGDVADTDEFAISDGGTMKKVDFSVVRDAVFADVSGDATVAAGGALTIAADSVEGTMLNTNVADTSTIELSSDTLSVLKVPNAITVDNATLQLNSGTTYDGGAARTISIKDGGVDADALASTVAGAGLAGGAGSALSVQVSGALKIASDKVGLSGSIAGDGLKFLGGADSISTLEVDLNELPAATVAVANDSIAIIDADDNGSKKESIVDFVASIASAAAGMQSASGQLGVNSGDGLKINGSNELVVEPADFAGAGLEDDGSDNLRIAASAAGNGLSGGGGSALGFDAHASGGLTDDVASSGQAGIAFAAMSAEDVAVDADFFMFADGGASGPVKKESIADLMTAVAGVGLTATAGVLNAGLDVALKADGNTLAKGFNYMADMTSDGEDTLNLPASNTLSVGDIIHVKAPSDCSQARTVKIARNGSQTIDGLTQLIIESPFGAVSMVYVAADTFRLI